MKPVTVLGMSSVYVYHEYQLTVVHEDCWNVRLSEYRCCISYPHSQGPVGDRYDGESILQGQMY